MVQPPQYKLITADNITDYIGAGTGDVVGPAGATANAIPRYSGVTGKLIKGSGITIDDSNDITLADGSDFIAGTTTGTKIGTATSQKIGFFNATPVVQQAAATDIATVMASLGLRASGAAFPITTSGVITAGSFVVGTPQITSGSGTPEAVVTAPIGSIFLRTDGSTNTSVYRKESGAGNTGWIAITNAGGGDVTAASTFGTDNRIVRSDGTGKGVQSTGISIDDSDDITFADGTDIVAGTTTGTKIGTATSQKLGFFNATPVIQPVAATDLGTVLSGLGLRVAGTAYPITTSGAVAISGLTTLSGANRLPPANRTGSVTLTGGTTNEFNTVDATSGNLTMTLAATATAGYIFTVMKTDATANTVTLSATSINGASTHVLTAQNQWVRVVSTTTSGTWNILGQTPTAGGGSGDVTAASNFTNDNRLIRSDGTTKGVQASTITVDDTGNVVLPASTGITLGTPQILAGSGSPEGAVTAPVGSTYQRSDGGANTTTYRKESGAGNTGWVADSASGTGDVTAASTFGTDNRIVRSDGVSKGVQATGISIDDSDDITLADGSDFVLGGTTGTKIGTASTGQKLGFFNATPAIQPAATVELGTTLSTLGLRAFGTAYPLATSGTADLTGGLHFGRQAVSTATTLNMASPPFIDVSAASPYNLTLPSTTTPGIFYWIKKTDANANAITVLGTFDGATNYVLNAQYQRVLVVSTSSSDVWRVLDSSTTTTANITDFATASGSLLNSTFGSNGLLTKTAANTWTSRTLTGTTNRIAVTNGDGVSGNPTIDIGTNIPEAAAAFATDNRLLRSDGTGRGLQASGITLDDSDDITLPEAGDIILGTTTGTKIGTSTSQKIGHFNSTPVVQPGATTDLGTVLSDLGLRAAGTAYPLTTSGSVTLTGGVSSSGQTTLSGNTRFTPAAALTTATPAPNTSAASFERIDTTSNNVAVTLPATTTAGLMFLFKRISAAETPPASPLPPSMVHRVTACPNQYDWVMVLSTTTSGTWEVVGKSASSGGSGDVTAASTFGTDNRLIRSDGTGKGVQSSGITIDDSDDITLPEAGDIILGTTTGSKIGTSTSQKIGFYNAAPVNQRGGSTDLGVVLSDLGLRGAGAAYPITTSADVAFTGSARYGRQAVTSATTLTTSSPVFIDVSNAGAQYNLTLPSTTTAGYVFSIKKTDNNANNIQILGTIDGMTNYTLGGQYQTVELVSTTSSGVWQIREQFTLPGTNSYFLMSNGVSQPATYQPIDQGHVSGLETRLDDIEAAQITDRRKSLTNALIFGA